MDVGASTTEYMITNLVVNDTYIITLVALSEHLPSAIVGPEIVIPGKAPVSGAFLDMGSYGLRNESIWHLCQQEGSISSKPHANFLQ